MNSQLLVRFRSSDSELGVTRRTVRKLAEQLGVDETGVIHIALAHMRDEKLPRYDRDDGPLSAAQLRQARSLVDQDRTPTESLFGTTQRERRLARKSRA